MNKPTLKESMHEKEVVQAYAKSRKRVIWLALLAVPIAIGGFVMAITFEADIGREQAGLLMLGSMVLAFMFFGLALHSARCPSCNRVQAYKIAGGHWRINLSRERCIHCDVKLRA